MNKESVSILSTLVNLVLGLSKLGLGLAAQSSALMAEGLHSAIDVVSSAITFLGIKIAKREPTKEHPYGWGRAEVLAGLAVTVFLAVAGLGIINGAVTSLLTGEHEAEINILALLVMTTSVVVNEVLARLKVKVGQREESLALIADGKHSRVDVLSSAGVLVGLVLTRFFPVADSVTALLVGIYILYETAVLGKEIGENLLDVADPEVENEIKKISEEQQVDLMTLKTRKIGALTSAELEISLPTETKISRADDLISELQETLIKKISRLEYVVIQIKGKGKRSRMLRGQCAETLERLGPEKLGWRVIEPYRDGQPYNDFGAPEYLVTDYRDDKEILRQTVKNPYYKIGRGHGVRFAQAVQADEVKAQNIGENARESLKNLKIKILEVKNLDVELDGEKIIQNLSFAVKKGEILTILGPNGAGKTVLLKTLLGLLPYRGEILWSKKLKIGYLPQGLTQLKVKDLPLSVEEFFKLKDVTKEDILKFLQLVGIKEESFLKKRLGDMSTGQFQRMLVAWVLITKPEVLLFDEPTTGIDIGGEETIYSLLHRFWQEGNLTILLVTHDLNIVYKYSSDVLCLNKKGISCSGQPKEILTAELLEKIYGTEIKFYQHVR